MFKKAIAADPRYALAYAGLGWSYYLGAINGWTEFPGQALEKALELGQKALSMGEPAATTRALIGSVYLRLGKYDLAISELQRAIEVNPNHALSYLSLGMVMLYAGRTDDAIQLLRIGIRFDPHSRQDHYWHLGLAYYLKGRYDEAIITLEQDLSQFPNSVEWNYIALAAAYARAGRNEDAQRAAQEVKKRHPFFDLENSFNLFRNPEDRKKFHDGLRMAGIE